MSCRDVGSSISLPAEMRPAIGARMSYARNVEIYDEGEPAEYLYKVISGAVRVRKLLDCVATSSPPTQHPT